MVALSRVPPQVPEHVAHVLDQLAPLGILEARRLFNARSLYCDRVIFAIVSKEQIYLKVDEESRPAFESEGMESFGPGPENLQQCPISPCRTHRLMMMTRCGHGLVWRSTQGGRDQTRKIGKSVMRPRIKENLWRWLGAEWAGRIPRG